MAHQAASGGLTMLTRLRLQNFKCWQDTGDIPLKPITGFFGANSSGKTSLIQALLLLKQTAESRDRGLVFDFGNRNTLVDLGDFESVIYGHDTGRPLKITLDWHPQGNLQYWGGHFDQARRDAEFDYRYGFEVDVRKGADVPFKPLLVERMAYRAGEAVFGMSRQDNGNYTVFSEGTVHRLVKRADQERPFFFRHLPSATVSRSKRRKISILTRALPPLLSLDLRKP